MNAQITLTPTVSGVINPTGSVTLKAVYQPHWGTATLANGMAMLQASFAPAGSWFHNGKLFG